jgi:hypothetical protein
MLLINIVMGAYAIFVAIVVSKWLLHKNRQIIVARGYKIKYNVDHRKSTIK